MACTLSWLLCMHGLAQPCLVHTPHSQLTHLSTSETALPGLTYNVHQWEQWPTRQVLQVPPLHPLPDTDLTLANRCWALLAQSAPQGLVFVCAGECCSLVHPTLKYIGCTCGCYGLDQPSLSLISVPVSVCDVDSHAELSQASQSRKVLWFHPSKSPGLSPSFTSNCSSLAGGHL